MDKSKPVPLCKICEHNHIGQCHFRIEEFVMTGTKVRSCNCKGDNETR